MQYLRGKALFLAQQAQKQVLRADVLVIQPLSFLSPVRQYTLTLVAEWQIYRRGNLLPHGGVPLDLLPDRFHGGVRSQKAIGESLILAQQTEQQVLSLDIRAAELAGLVSSEKNDSSRFLGIPFKHGSDAPYY
jgi:hypothetical protein